MIFSVVENVKSIKWVVAAATGDKRRPDKRKADRITGQRAALNAPLLLAHIHTHVHSLAWLWLLKYVHTQTITCVRVSRLAARASCLVLVAFNVWHVNALFYQLFVIYFHFNSWCSSHGPQIFVCVCGTNFFLTNYNGKKLFDAFVALMKSFVWRTSLARWLVGSPSLCIQTPDKE